MNVVPTPLRGLYVLEPRVFTDERGFFMEVYRQDTFKSLGLEVGQFVQSNHSKSHAGVVRGLHFQWDPPLTKLIRVINGQAFMVAVDIRYNSPTRGQWFGVEVSALNKKELLAPFGFATGFCVVGEVAEVEYQYTAHYNPMGESVILWNDPGLNIEWPVEGQVRTSDRDSKGTTLEEWLRDPRAKLI